MKGNTDIIILYNILDVYNLIIMNKSALFGYNTIFKSQTLFVVEKFTFGVEIWFGKYIGLLRCFKA